MIVYRRWGETVCTFQNVVRKRKLYLKIISRGKTYEGVYVDKWIRTGLETSKWASDETGILSVIFFGILWIRSVLLSLCFIFLIELFSFFFSCPYPRFCFSIGEHQNLGQLGCRSHIPPPRSSVDHLHPHTPRAASGLARGGRMQFTCSCLLLLLLTATLTTAGTKCFFFIIIF